MSLTLTIEQRDRLRAIPPQYEQKTTGRGYPRVGGADVIKVFEGILWLLVSGARWEDIDKRKYASPRVPSGCCNRYFQEWVEQGIFQQALQILAADLEDKRLLDLQESFPGTHRRWVGCFVPAGTRVRVKGAMPSV